MSDEERIWKERRERIDQEEAGGGTRVVFVPVVYASTLWALLVLGFTMGVMWMVIRGQSGTE